ncbi:hypothetical protein [Phenylobacterium sp.]|jgi:hypothetical protein|uniref:hypothetical protein n=1 Tax=Phenylobacterium sp. TaxID=1871053 RepID=UPI002F3E7388
MNLVQLRGQLAWGLLDETRGIIRDISGGLSAWAPLIAGGAGAWALPLNGRAEPLRPLAGIEPAMFKRVMVSASCPAQGRALGVVMGACLTGRRSPLQSVCGYVGVTWEAGEPRPGPILVTGEEFAERAPGGQADRLAVALLAREETAALATGDLVIVPWTDPAPDLVDIFWRQPTTAKRP